MDEKYERETLPPDPEAMRSKYEPTRYELVSRDPVNMRPRYFTNWKKHNPGSLFGGKSAWNVGRTDVSPETHENTDPKFPHE